MTFWLAVAALVGLMGFACVGAWIGRWLGEKWKL